MNEEPDPAANDRRRGVSRRHMLQLAGAGVVGVGGSLLGAQSATAQARVDPVDCAVGIGRACGRSELQLGLVDADKLLMNGDPTAVASAERLMHSALRYDNVHIMAWGAEDPWPDPSGPFDFSSIDAKLKIALAAGVTPVITFCEAPWWMKGVLNADGSTTPLTSADEWGSAAYGSRVLDNKMSQWQKLVTAITERYVVAPWNVRHFMVWNELKGYFNPVHNVWDASNSPGDPSGPNAEHGYTYLYNLTRKAVRRAAHAAGVRSADVQIGGPYVPLTLRPLPGSSEITGDYGYVDQLALDAVRTWCEQQDGAEFFVIDGWNIYWTNDGLVYPPAGAFAANQVFADVVRWIRSLPFKSARALPIWYAEWYAIGSDTSDRANNAIKASAAIRYMYAGGAVALNWTGTGDGTPSGGLWSATTDPGGGRPTEWFNTAKLLRQHFGPNTVLLRVTSSSPDVEAAASRDRTLLVNTTDRPRTVSVNRGRTVRLSPYQVVVINTPR